MTPAFTLDNYRAFFVTEGFFDPQSRRFPDPLGLHPHAVDHVSLHHHSDGDLPDLAYPMAYFLSCRSERFQTGSSRCFSGHGPFWTSYLIRAVAWLPMLGRHGLINDFLMSLGAIDEPVSFFLYSSSATRWRWCSSTCGAGGRADLLLPRQDRSHAA